MPRPANDVPASYQQRQNTRRLLYIIPVSLVGLALALTGIDAGARASAEGVISASPVRQSVVITKDVTCHMVDNGTARGSWVYCYVGLSAHPKRHAKLSLNGHFSLTATTPLPGGLGGPLPRSGEKTTVGRFQCEVVNPHADSIKCTVVATGKGFLISKQRIVRVGADASTPARLASRIAAVATALPLTWSAPSRIDDINDLTSVSCPSASFCAAVDGNNITKTGKALTWNGTAWSAPTTIDTSGSLTSVSCASASFCMAVSSYGDDTYSWNGTSWSTDVDPGQNLLLNSVSCPSTTFCMAVNDADGGAGFIWNGSAWSIDPIGEGDYNGLESVSCPSSSFCMALDDEGTAFTWSGGSWSGPTDTNIGLEDGDGLDATHPSVSCASASFCMAVGGDDTTVFWNGSSWSATPSISHVDDLLSVSCPSASFCVALAGNYGLYAFIWNGVSWSAPTDIDPSNNGFSPTVAGVSCPSASFCTAVNENGYAVRTNAYGGSAAPVLGHTASLKTVSGSVVIKLPGTSTFVALTAVGQIPFGTVIDATHGRLKVTTAGPHGGTQTGEFFEGEFVLTQERSGLVVATLTGGNFSGCPTTRERSHVARASSKHASRKHVVRKLWTDAHGSFSTKGNYAAATVRGTEWLTEDLCEGTLIRVTRDSVAVTNLVNHGRVTVRAGHRYLAKAP